MLRVARKRHDVSRETFVRLRGDAGEGRQLHPAPNAPNLPGGLAVRPSRPSRMRPREGRACALSWMLERKNPNVSRETSVRDGAGEDHDEETADGERGVRACGVGGRGARGGGLPGHAVVRADRDGGEAACRRRRARHPRGVVDEREVGLGVASGCVVHGRALPVHLQAGGAQRCQRRADELELRGREGRHGAVRGRRSRSHLVADRAGHAPLRQLREAAGARSRHARPGLRHDAGRIRPVRALPYARHRASHHAHQPRLDVLRRRGRHRRASGARRGLRARPEVGHLPAPRLPGARRDQRAFGGHRARFRRRSRAGRVQPDGRGRRAVDRGCTNECFT